MSSKNSTNVRNNRARWLRRGFAAAQRLSPRLGAALATRLFVHTPARRKNSSDDSRALGSGKRLELSFESETLAVWTWGAGPVVLLVHGWGGSAGQLHPFVGPLVQAGFTAVAFDAPGHGASTGNWLTLARYASAIAHVAAAVGPLHAIIAHSFGAPASSLAASEGLRVDRAVQIGPPADALRWFRRFSDGLGLTEQVELLARSSVERRAGIGLDWLNAAVIEPLVMRPLLVVHDWNDAEVPWTDGMEVAKASPQAVLRMTRGLGHRRILRDPEVVSDVVAFVRDEPLGGFATNASPRWQGIEGPEVHAAGLRAAGGQHCSRCGGALTDPQGETLRLCDRCELQMELFDRAARWERAGRPIAA